MQRVGTLDVYSSLRGIIARTRIYWLTFPISLIYSFTLSHTSLFLCSCNLYPLLFLPASSRCAFLPVTLVPLSLRFPLVGSFEIENISHCVFPSYCYGDVLRCTLCVQLDNPPRQEHLVKLRSSTPHFFFATSPRRHGILIQHRRHAESIPFSCVSII